MIKMEEYYQRVWNWYSRDSVQKALLEVSKNREVVSVFKDSRFGKRPDIIQYPLDILHSVAEGALAFHGSVERWSQPMKLDVGLSKGQLDELRIGWDILIDVDVDNFEIAKIATKQIIEALNDHGIKNYSCKFTGGSSFHIGIPFESLPKSIDNVETRKMYPELFKKVVEYLKWYTKDQIRNSILSVFSAAEVSQRVNKKLSEIIGTDGNLDPFKFITIDVFGSRHLFRLPYSLHESKLLVSLPIKPSRIDNFKIEEAFPEKVKVEEKFLEYKGNLHDAEGLVIEAIDWVAKNKIKIEEPLPKIKKFQKMKEIPEEYFPPCIKRCLEGLQDGRKRAVFILITFLQNMGWSAEKIEERLLKWNEKNVPPLRASYIRTQLRWHMRQSRNLLPPNCDHENFYKSIGLYSFCEELHKMGIKNPVAYAVKQFSKKKKK
jgi:hypothetical protein